MPASRSSSTCYRETGQLKFYPDQNAPNHAPSIAIRKRFGAELRTVWNAPDLTKAETALAEPVKTCRDTAPKLADRLEKNVPEGLTVFSRPEHHHRRLRTSNPIERAIQQELNRRTVKVRVFPSEESLERLVSAVLVEINERWAVDTKAYKNGNARMRDHAKSQFPANRLLNPDE